MSVEIVPNPFLEVISSVSRRPRHVGMDVWRRSHGHHIVRCGADEEDATQMG
jgi:hypothetical protein